MIVLIVSGIVHDSLQTFGIFLHLRCQRVEHRFGAFVCRLGAVFLYQVPDCLVVVQYRARSKSIVGEWHGFLDGAEER